MPVPLALARKQQPDALIIANGALCNACSLGQLTDTHKIAHFCLLEYDVNVMFPV
jgi:hypothetical protein